MIKFIFALTSLCADAVLPEDTVVQTPNKNQVEQILPVKTPRSKTPAVHNPAKTVAA